jgi:hypothetical protein
MGLLQTGLGPQTREVVREKNGRTGRPRTGGAGRVLGIKDGAGWMKLGNWRLVLLRSRLDEIDAWKDLEMRKAGWGIHFNVRASGQR